MTLAHKTCNHMGGKNLAKESKKRDCFIKKIIFKLNLPALSKNNFFTQNAYIKSTKYLFDKNK